MRNKQGGRISMVMKAFFTSEFFDFLMVSISLGAVCLFGCWLCAGLQHPALSALSFLAFAWPAWLCDRFERVISRGFGEYSRAVVLWGVVRSMSIVLMLAIGFVAALAKTITLGAIALAVVGIVVIYVLVGG